MTAEPSRAGAPTSVYDRIGGPPVVDDIVDVFHGRILGDPELAPFFAATDMPRLRAHQGAFISAALGGPHHYTGRTMGVAHAGMGIAGGHFDRVVAHLVAAMEACGVPLDLISTIFDALAPLRSEIVEHS